MTVTIEVLQDATTCHCRALVPLGMPLCPRCGRAVVEVRIERRRA